MKKKRALSVMETAVTVGIVVVIAVLAVGMFTDGLHGLIANGGSAKYIKSDGAQAQKTAYQTYNRDYSATQIEVQVTGEQGLEMLRRKANNMALGLINSDYTSKAIEIAYLSRVVEIITGESYFCEFMQKNSEEHCQEFTKYAYKTSVTSALTIPEKTSDLLPLGKAASVLAAVVVPKDGAGYAHYSDDKNKNIKARYDAIYDLTMAMRALVSDKSVLLMSEYNKYRYNSINKTLSDEGPYAKTFASVVMKLQDAHNKCKCNFVEDVPRTNLLSNKSQCGNYILGGTLSSKKREKMRADHRFVNNGSITQFNNAVKSIETIDDLKKLLENPNSALLEPVRRDNYYSEGNNACAKLNEAIKSLGLEPVECVPYGSYDKW